VATATPTLSNPLKSKSLPRNGPVAPAATKTKTDQLERLEKGAKIKKRGQNTNTFANAVTKTAAPVLERSRPHLV